MHTLQKITKLSWVFVLASMFFYSCNTKNPDEPEEALLVLKFSNMNLIFEKNGNIEIDAILNNILVTPSAKAETKEGKFTLKKLTNINPQDIIALSGVGTPSFAIVMKKQGDFTADLHLLDGNKKEKILKNCVFSLFYKQPVFKESEAEKQQRLNLKKRFDDLMRDYYSGQITAANFNDWAYQIKPYFRKPNPSTTEARPPKMSENFKKYALSWWNFYKEMAQTNICEIGTQDQEIASYAAYGLSVNEQITHRMPNPKGISPNIYDKAKTGALRSNLFGGRGNWSYHRTVQFNFTEGKIPDEGPLNHIPSLSQMGHRWNGLYRNNASVGIENQKNNFENWNLLLNEKKKLDYPFQITGHILNGKRFFEYVQFYIKLKEELEELHKKLNYENKKFSTKKGTYRPMVDGLFKRVSLFYYDKFGNTELEEAIKYCYAWVFILNKNLLSVGFPSIDNKGADGNNGKNISGIKLFQTIRDALYHNQVIGLDVKNQLEIDWANIPEDRRGDKKLFDTI